MHSRGILAFEDGSTFVGQAFGAVATTVGEAVFNTSMTGYQEILTDPSYYGQIVTLTAPQIGNTGVNAEDEESSGPKAFGLVVRDVSPVVSNWRATQSLPEYLNAHGIPGLSGVDTRAITKRIRVEGALKACLTTDPDVDAAEAVRRAQAWPGLVGVDYVKEVTASTVHRWTPRHEDRAFAIPGTQLAPLAPEPPRRYHLVCLDMGLKYNTLRRLHAAGFDITVVPAQTQAEAIRALEPEALFVSNGPGDPAAVPYAHETLRALLPHYPAFGICMGHQMLTHAFGGQTEKLKFGHRGGNQPVKDLTDDTVAITSQNHGFASRREALEAAGMVITEYNMNDDTVAGLKHPEWPVFAVQYHPEASPGPHDSADLFHRFYQLVAEHVGAG